MDFPIYNLEISTKVQDDAEVSFIALVDQPAIKRDFLKFNEQMVFAIEDEQIVTGPLMIPDQLIYRKSEKFGEHYVKFSAKTIKDIAIKYAKKGYQNNVNLMHDAAMQVQNITMFQSFISDSAKGIKPMEAFKDLPDGTWFGTFKVDNPEVWQLVKENKLKGFSVEGMFDYEIPQTDSGQLLEQLKSIFAQL